MNATAIATGFAGTVILPCMRRAVGYADLLVRDIPAVQFTHMPHPTMNHPAFCLGHLSLYPDRICTLLGRDDLVAPIDGWGALFGAGAACVPDPARYPARDVILAAFRDGYDRAGIALAGAGDERLHMPNPLEGRIRELFPTVGIAVNFMAGAHLMMHLGQVSAWRRAVGLPSVM
ncbi:MAG: DinB family protein [Phycisphaeraceae bacterium]|nr:DinB family protein [Phycisphaeraceae bacterium]